MIGNKLAFSSRGGKTSCSLFCLRPRDVTNSELLDHVAHWAICDLLLMNSCKDTRRQLLLETLTSYSTSKIDLQHTVCHQSMHTLETQKIHEKTLQYLSYST